MNWLNVLGISIGLAMDAFAVSIAAALAVAPVTFRHLFRLSFHFGLFQFMMPLVGWLAGRTLAAHISRYDHWVAFGLLGLVGLKMLWDARGEKKPDSASDPTRGLTLVALSVATSIDALAVGVSLAMLDGSIWLPCMIIGLVAAAFSAVGVGMGTRIGSKAGRWAEAAGGGILMTIGTRILVTHLTV